MRRLAPLLLLAGCSQTDSCTVADPGVALWYNRPAATTLGDVTYVGYLRGATPMPWLEHGRRLVNWLNRPASIVIADGHTIMLKRWDRFDDHSPPAVIAFRGRIITAYSNHDSALFARPLGAPEQQIEQDGATYPKLLALPDRLQLFYAMRSKGGRVLVMRETRDGSRWGSARIIIDAGAGRHVYAAAPAYHGGTTCLTWSTFWRQAHRDVRITCSTDNFTTHSTRLLHRTPPGGDSTPFDLVMSAEGPVAGWAECRQGWTGCRGVIAYPDRIIRLPAMPTNVYPTGLAIDPADSTRVVAGVYREGRPALAEFNPRFVRYLRTRDVPMMPMFDAGLRWMEVSRYQATYDVVSRLVSCSA